MDAVIFIGIQGSGKTTFYRRQFFDTHVRLNLDMLKTRHRERLLLECCIAARQSFVVDNTNVLRHHRAVYISHAHGGGFRVSGYFFEPDARRAILWNSQRHDKAVIPVKALLGTLKRLERPHPEEGFDDLYRVRVDKAGKFIVDAWDSPV